jgi:hypothetical protein
MNKLLISVLVLLSCSAKQSTHEIRQGTYRFVGNKEGVFFFVDIDSNVLVEVNEKLEVRELQEPNISSDRLLYYGNCGAVFRSKNQGLDVRVNGEKPYSLETRNEIVSVQFDKDCKKLAYSSYDKFFVVDPPNLSLEFNGSFPQIINNNIFYNKSSDDDSYVDLYQQTFSPNVQENENLVLKQVYEDGLLVFNSGDLIACQIPVNGQPKKIIYNTNHRKFRIIDDAVIQNENYYPLVDEHRSRLVYYNPKGLEIRSVEIPKTFDMER